VGKRLETNSGFAHFAVHLYIFFAQIAIQKLGKEISFAVDVVSAHFQVLNFLLNKISPKNKQKLVQTKLNNYLNPKEKMSRSCLRIYPVSPP